MEMKVCQRHCMNVRIVSFSMLCCPVSVVLVCAASYEPLIRSAIYRLLWSAARIHAWIKGGDCARALIVTYQNPLQKKYSSRQSKKFWQLNTIARKHLPPNIFSLHLRLSSTHCEGHDGILRVHAVLGLVVDDRLGSVDDGVGDFYAAIGGETMHVDGVFL